MPLPYRFATSARRHAATFGFAMFMLAVGVACASSVGRYARTAAETVAGARISDESYPELDIRRYGAKGDYDTGSETDGQVPDRATNNLAAINAAVKVAGARGGGTIRIEGGDYYVSNSIDARGVSNLYFDISPGTTLRATRYTRLGGLLVLGHTGPVGSGVSNVGVVGGGTLRTFRPDHDTVPAHQTSHGYVVGEYVLSTDRNGNERAYYCKVAGKSGAGSPPDVINGSDKDGTIVWQDADNDNVIGAAADGVRIEGMSIPAASGKPITVQIPNWKNVRILNNRIGMTNDKGIEVKGNTATAGQESAFGDGVQIAGNTIESAGHEGIEVEQSSFSSALNRNCRVVGNLVRAAGVIDRDASGIRVNRCRRVEVRGNQVLHSSGHGYHIRRSTEISGDLHSENAGLSGVFLQENDGFDFDSIHVRNAAGSGVAESGDMRGGRVGRLVVAGGQNAWKASRRKGRSPEIESVDVSNLKSSTFSGPPPSVLPRR